RQGEGTILSVLGQVAQFRGRFAAAKDNLQQALVIAREAGDQQGEGADLSVLGQIALAVGRTQPRRTIWSKDWPSRARRVTPLGGAQPLLARSCGRGFG